MEGVTTVKLLDKDILAYSSSDGIWVYVPEIRKLFPQRNNSFIYRKIKDQNLKSRHCTIAERDAYNNAFNRSYGLVSLVPISAAHVLVQLMKTHQSPKLPTAKRSLLAPKSASSQSRTILRTKIREHDPELEEADSSESIGRVRSWLGSSQSSSSSVIRTTKCLSSSDLSSESDTESDSGTSSDSGSEFKPDSDAASTTSTRIEILNEIPKPLAERPKSLSPDRPPPAKKATYSQSVQKPAKNPVTAPPSESRSNFVTPKPQVCKRSVPIINLSYIKQKPINESIAPRSSTKRPFSEVSKGGESVFGTLKEAQSSITKHIERLITTHETFIHAIRGSLENLTRINCEMIKLDQERDQ